MTEEEPMTNGPKRTSKGRPVTDAQIDDLATEAERGYDVERVKRAGGRRPLGTAAAKVIPVRLDPDLEAALKRRAEADKSNASEVIRDALRAWLKTA
jgi:hypothetical protein